MFQRHSSPGAQTEKKPTGSRKLSWKTIAWLSALPSLFAFVISLFVHAGAIGAMVALGYPTNLDEPEPVAVNVELDSDTATQDSSPEKEQKVEALPVAAEATTSDSIDVAEPVEAEDTVALAATEDVPAAVPVPIIRPKQQQRKNANQSLEKSPLAKTKGKAIDQNFDIGQAEELVQINTSASANALEARRGETRTSSAEQRWLAQLSAHLERRKRFPLKLSPATRKVLFASVLSLRLMERLWQLNWLLHRVLLCSLKKCWIFCGGPRRFQNLRPMPIQSSRFQWIFRSSVSGMWVASEIRYQARSEGSLVRGYVVDLSRRSGWTQPGVDIIMPLVVTTLWGKHA